MHKFTIGEALSVGWDKTKKHFWFLLAFVVGTMIVSWLPGTILGGFESQHDEVTVISFLVMVVNFAIGILIQTGWIRLTIKLLDDVRGTWHDFLANSKVFWNMVGGTILYTLICLVGFILLIVPGIIWSIKYRFYSYLIVDKGMSAVDALKESARMTQGEKMNLFLFGLASVLVALVGLIALFIGLLWAIPTIAIGFAYIYRRLSGAPTATTHFAESPAPAAQ